MKKWIAAVVLVVLVIAAAVWYKAGSAPAVVETPETAATPAPAAAPVPAATPAPTATPETAATPEPTPAAAETTSDTDANNTDSGEYTIENYNKITDEEWAAMSDEEKQKWREVRNEQLGGGDVSDISEEKTQEAFDMLNDPNNPYIQEILEYKASLNK